jgi:hypothetical protein
MRPHAIRLLTLAIYTTAMAVLMVTVDEGEASSRHIRKHHALQSHSFRNSWAAGELGTSAPSYTPEGNVCPGSARSFDCKIWPPPIDDDPDRNATDGGP